MSSCSDGPRCFGFRSELQLNISERMPIFVLFGNYQPDMCSMIHRNMAPYDSMILCFSFLACMKQHMENKVTQPANEDLVGAHFFQGVYKDKRENFVYHITLIQKMRKQTNIQILLTDMHEFLMDSYYNHFVQEPTFVDVHLFGKLSPPLANWITPGQVISRWNKAALFCCHGPRNSI